MSYNNITPCVGCEEVCKRIETTIRSYLYMMNWEQTKIDVWAFWRTLCAFMRHENDVSILEELYDNSMSSFNQFRVSKEDFIAYMTQSTI